MKDPSYFDSRDNNLWSKSNPNIDEVFFYLKSRMT